MTYIEFFPWPFVISLMGLIVVTAHYRYRGWLYQPGIFMFGLYLMVVAQRVFFPIIIPEGWPASVNWGENFISAVRRINWIPFYYGPMFADLDAGKIPPQVVVWEIAGNVLLTIPFGAGLGFFSQIRGRRMLGTALVTGLALEGTQLLLSVLGLGRPRSVDINDVILNSLGVLIGFGLFLIMERRFLRNAAEL